MQVLSSMNSNVQLLYLLLFFAVGVAVLLVIGNIYLFVGTALKVCPLSARSSLGCHLLLEQNGSVVCHCVFLSPNQCLCAVELEIFFT